MAKWPIPAFIRLSTLLRRESKCVPVSKLKRLSNPWLREGRAFVLVWVSRRHGHDLQIPTGCDGYRAEEGVSGTELREGESSALRIVCS